MTQAIRSADMRPGIDTIAAASLFFLTFFWGLNQVAIKVANAGYNPLFALVVRSVVGCALVALWCWWRKIPLLERDGTLWPGILSGLMFGIEFMLIFNGLDHTTAARGTLMLHAMPFWMLLGGYVLLGERISWRKFSGMVMAFAGVAVVFSDNLSLPNPDAVVGDLLCLAASLFWAGTILVVKGSALATARPEKTLLYQLAVAAVIAAPFIPLGGPVLREVSPVATAALVFQSTFIVAFTYVLWYWLVRTYPAAGVSSFTFLTPVFGVLLGGVLLNEPLSMRIFAALALIAAGLLIVNRQDRRPEIERGK